MHNIVNNMCSVAEIKLNIFPPYKYTICASTGATSPSSSSSFPASALYIYDIAIDTVMIGCDYACGWGCERVC